MQAPRAAASAATPDPTIARADAGSALAGPGSASPGPSGAPTLSHWPSWPVPFGLDLERSPAEDCPYLRGRAMRVRGFACEWVAGRDYQRLLDAGFRRSGRVYYQPACNGCRECVPIRVPLARFVPSRSQRRVIRRNRDLAVQLDAPVSTDEKHGLFVRYLSGQHDGTMSGERESFEDFLFRPSTDSIELSYRDPGGRLVGLGVCDVTPTSLSSVYFAWEPAERRRGLGTFSALAEMDWALRTGRRWYYLGYWVRGCRRMAYKARFRPAEALGLDGVWRETA